MLTLLALLVSTGTARASDPVSGPVWLVPALDGGLSGGIHSTYARTVANGKVDLTAGFGLVKDKGLLGPGTDVGQGDYYLSALVPILGLFETGIQLSGLRTDCTGCVGEDQISSFGDVRLSAKYAHGDGIGSVAVFGTYDLFQGVDGRSSISDIATPGIGLAFSLFGEQAVSGLPARLHVSGQFIYDRTINFLKGTRNPSAIERMAWTMRDYLWAEGVAGLELLAGPTLIILEYVVEVAAEANFDDRPLVHTGSAAIRFAARDDVWVTAGGEGFIGDRFGLGPAVPDYRVFASAGYRFGGALNTRRAVVAPASADTMPAQTPDPEPTPAADLNDAEPEPVSLPVDDDVTPDPAPQPAAKPQPVAEPATPAQDTPERGKPEPGTEQSREQKVPEAASDEEAAATIPSDILDKPAPDNSANEALGLDNFEP